MIHYKYRWFYMGIIFLFILGLGFICDIKPQLDRLQHATNLESELTKKLTQLKSEKKPDRKGDYILATPSESLASLFMLAHRIGITVSSLNSNKARTYKLIFQGGYSKMSSFLLLAHHEFPALLIKNFNYTIADNNKLLLTVEMEFDKFMPTHFNKPHQKISAQHPFCEFSFNSVTVNSYNASIKHMKMVGFLQQGDRQVALILMPNNQMILARLGTYLGKEQGKVSQLNEYQLILTLPNKTKFILKK